MSPDHLRPDPARATRSLLALGALLLVVALGGCGHKIGDACSSSADCDPSGGTRTCDLSQPGGYCIIDGCDARSCPSDSVCARFFPEQPLLPVKSCDPESPVACAADEICLPDANAMTASCVRMSLERRACVESCGGDGDCRGGYVCRALGQCGTAALTLDSGGAAGGSTGGASRKAMPKFCAPAPTSPATPDSGLCPL